MASATPLESRLVLTLPQLASLVGLSKPSIYARLNADPEALHGRVRLPTGAWVPVHRDTPLAHWRVARSAVDRALEPTS